MRLRPRVYNAERESRAEKRRGAKDLQLEEDSKRTGHGEHGVALTLS